MKAINLILVAMLLITIAGTASAEEKKFNSVSSTDWNLNGKISVDKNADQTTLKYNEKAKSISIKSSVHETKTVKIKGSDLKNLLGTQGGVLGITHISDDGKISNYLKLYSVDVDGYVYLDLEFSENIISGFTGHTVYTANNVTGDTTINFSESMDVSSLNCSITPFANWQKYFIVNITCASDYNGVYALTNSEYTMTADEFSSIDVDGGGQPIINVTYSNGTSIPFYASVWAARDNYTLLLNGTLPSGTNLYTIKYNTTSYATSAGNENNIYSSTVISQNKSVTASTAVAGYEAVKANDGDTATGYKTSVDHAYWDVNLSSNYVVEDVNIYKLDDGTGVQSSFRYDIEYWNGSAYVDTSAADMLYADGGTSPDIWYNYSITPVTTSIIRWQMNSATSNYAMFRELQVYGYPVDDFTPVLNSMDSYNSTDSFYVNVSVTGDHNNSIYSSGENKVFDLIPTSAIDHVDIDTNSTDMSYSLTLYWTGDTVLYSESVDNGYANITVLYTPAETITSGIFNATYSLIDFSEHDYIGSLSCTVDGADKTAFASRTNEDVNVSVSNLDTSTHYINFSIPFNPIPGLSSPADSASLNYTYPPLTHDVVLNWTATTGIYSIRVYEGASIVYQSSPTTNTATATLPAGSYTWNVRGYDDVFGEYSSYETRSFSIIDEYNYTDNETGVHGVVYESLAGVDTAVNGALVTCYNDTWSDELLTDDNGHYEFYNISNGTYYLTVTKDRYNTPQTQIVTVVSSEMYLKNIYIERNTGEYYSRHDVQFVVRSFTGTTYPNVEVNAYIDSSNALMYTDSTDSSGSVVFAAMDTDVKYRLTFINESQNIDEEQTLYPVDTYYDIFVFGASLIPEDRETEDILFGAYGSTINLTSGYINVTYNDTSESTTLAEVWVNYSSNGTNVQSANSTNDTDSWSWVVAGGNESYIVHFRINTTELDDPLDVTRTISFHDVVTVGLGYDSAWKYQFTACFILVALALLASRQNAEKMAVILVLAGWGLVSIGWLTVGLSAGEKLTLGLMMLLGTVIAFGASIKAGEDR
ncbi:MAG: hypothetical protein JXA38_04070 [Methanosarcinaceae archaeon]|nr:hypothetical protein [Methanosarcinaceae archaeon]